VSEVTVSHSSFWTLHVWNSTDVRITDVTVYNPTGSSHTDGLDIDSSTNVLVTGASVETSDDCVSVKSGAGRAGIAFGRPTTNVLVTASDFTLCPGLALGSETAGGLTNVTFSHCRLSLVSQPVRVKQCKWDGPAPVSATYRSLKIDGAAVGVAINSDYECEPTERGIFSTSSDAVAHPSPLSLTLTDIHGVAATAGTFGCFASPRCLLTASNLHLVALRGWHCSNVSSNSTSSSVHPPACW
jgi:polygalacturonase